MKTMTSSSIQLSEINVKESKSLLTPAFWRAVEFNRFGIVPALLTVIICLTAFAAASAIYSGIGLMILIGLPTAFFISFIIAVAPMKNIFALSLILLIIDISILLYHFL